MKVAVTGASGFIAQHVCKALLQEGHEVIGLDINPVENVWGQWFYADITKPLAPIPNLDAVIHLAALSHPRQCDADPAKAYAVNVAGTANVLKMALESGARKVVFSSSAHVYDIPPKYMPSDEVHPLRLNNTYTTTKILGEQLCELYYQNHGLSYTTLRLFNAYGPNQQLGLFVPDMIEKAKVGPFTLNGANTTKDFVFIDDVARAFLLALETPFVGAINVGTGVESQLGDVAKLIFHAMGSELTCTNADRATRMQADPTRAKRVLGWEPAISLKEGLSVICNSAKVAV